MSTRIVVVEDHPLMLRALVEVLEQDSGFEVAGTATSGAQVAPLVARARPDLVLLDLQIPGLDGLGCLRQLRESSSRASVVVFSGAESRETIEQVLREGAAAFVSKSIDPFDLPAVLRAALLGSVYFSTPQVTRETVADVQSAADHEQARRSTGLTPRELEILVAVSGGLSNRAIGSELFLSDQTVKFHLNRIYKKLGVANRTEAAGQAHRLGLGRDLVHAG